MTINYEERQNKFISQLRNDNIELAVITYPTNIYYMTGMYVDPHERYMSLFFDVNDDVTHLFLPALDKEIAVESAKVDNIIPISDEKDPFTIIETMIEKRISAMGIEMNVVTVTHHNGLKGSFPEAEFIDIRPKLDEMRTFKSREEIDGLKEAVNIIEKVLEEGLKTVRKGMTEAELVAEFEYLMKKFGAAGPSFSTMVLSGEKAALPHGTPGDRELQDADFLLIDFGVITNDRYCSDMTRTFIIGESTDKQKKIYDIVKTSAQAGVNAVKAGVPLKEFDIAARNVIEENGYGDYFNNRVGHGLGIEVHEAPSIHKENDAIAEKGMLFTIEPGIYIPEYGGVRIEEEVYINEDGEAEVLTSYPRELQIIDLK